MHLTPAVFLKHIDPTWYNATSRQDLSRSLRVTRVAEGLFVRSTTMTRAEAAAQPPNSQPAFTAERHDLSTSIAGAIEWLGLAGGVFDPPAVRGLPLLMRGRVEVQWRGVSRPLNPSAYGGLPPYTFVSRRTRRAS